MKILFMLILICEITTVAFAQGNLIQSDHCTIDAAYANGVLDAKNKVNSRVDFAVVCDVPKDFHDRLNAVYRSGYQNGAANISVSQESCLTSASGDKVCGYDCKKDRYDEVTCAPFPTQDCLKDRYTQKVVCGYNCIKSTNGTVYCGKFYDDNCIQDPYGIAKCGLNCRLEGGSIHCAQRIFPTYSSRPFLKMEGSN